ncbi:MAG: exodeoxyribonuclease VII small subunit [Anaerolineae bacterium]|nr:exodeoxyribonuclease VII small subunit [Anaerolineae bacterium]
MSDISALSFEAAYAELEQIISKLEVGDLPLEQSVELFERGRQLSQHCQTLLDKVELRVNQITSDGRITPLA